MNTPEAGVSVKDEEMWFEEANLIIRAARPASATQPGEHLELEFKISIDFVVNNSLWRTLEHAATLDSVPTLFTEDDDSFRDTMRVTPEAYPMGVRVSSLVSLWVFTTCIGPVIELPRSPIH